LVSESGLEADDDPNEKPDEGADGALLSESALGADDDPNEKPDEDVVDDLLSESALGAADDPNENPDDGAGVDASPDLDDEPNEKDEAEGPLGDPLGGTAAPNANAVEGEVFGCLAPKENENDLAGVEVSPVGLGVSSFFSAGVVGLKVNPLEGVSFFSVFEVSLGG
jgi:hypothetical protein